MVASIALYLLFEFPFKRIIDYCIMPYCSQDETLHLFYVRRKAKATKYPIGSKISIHYEDND